MPSRARTNCPVKGSPHFLQILSWPLAVRAPRCRDRFLSPLRRESSSRPGGGMDMLEPADPVGLSLYMLSGVRLAPFWRFLSAG